MPAIQEADNGETVVILAWTLLTLTILVVTLRLYARISRVHGLRTDDYLMVCSVICGLAHSIFLTIAWRHGLGRHFDTLSADRQQSVLRLIVAGVELFVIITSVFGRISFCVFLLYVIAPTDILKKRILCSVIGVQIAANLVCLIQIYAQCGDKVEALWNFATAELAQCQSPMIQTMIGYGVFERCIRTNSRANGGAVQSALNSLCDVVLTILPATILWNLQMPLAQKIGLGTVLTLSIFALAASIAKCIAIGNLGKGDLTWYMVQLQIWCVVENNTVSLAASIPALRPLLRRPDPTSSPAHSYETRDSLIKGQPHNRFGQSHHAATSHVISDGHSEEYILSPMVAGGGDHITKTTAVSVAFEPMTGASNDRGRSNADALPSFL